MVSASKNVSLERAADRHVVHKVLSNNDMVHHEISPGNVLLAGSPDAVDVHGILYDAESARKPSCCSAKMVRAKAETVDLSPGGYSGLPELTPDMTKRRTASTSLTHRGANMTVCGVCVYHP